MGLNGRFADSELAAIPGGRLATPYALRWNLMVAACRRAGVAPPMPNGPASSYRTLAQQVQLRASWCAAGQCGNAAIPGTSNHGIGRAVDTNQKATAIRYGKPYGVRDPSDAPWESWHTLVHLDPVEVPPPPREPTLRKGIINRAAVTRLQKLLVADGIKAPVNGRYDLATRRAVRRFQKAHNLPVDGVAGTSTWAAINEAVRH
jgi:hypothetical protein